MPASGIVFHPPSCKPDDGPMRLSVQTILPFISGGSFWMSSNVSRETSFEADHIDPLLSQFVRQCTAAAPEPMTTTALSS